MDKMEIEQRSHSFILEQELVAFETTLQRYCCRRTGLRVAYADVRGPLVNGYFVLPTEAHDDDGCPHVLEHLIFLGSEQYPFKGILDGLANRCYADGTNAWTDTDHTAYTLSTAGCEGFLNLLPIYIEHILFPTLTAEGFHTEVHHITGNGEDAGVVYCEMQARENIGQSRCWNELVRCIFGPPEVCGYSAETGGKTANLRTLNVGTVRSYHKEFYRPDNLLIILIGHFGQIEHVFQALDPVIDKIVSRFDPSAKKCRPWTSPVPSLDKSTVKEVLFPDDDEEVGMVYYASRGPQYNDFHTLAALDILGKYLTEDVVSPLAKAMVDIPEPISTEISPHTLRHSVSASVVEFEGVPLSKISSIKDTFFDVINDVAKQDGSGIDLARMREVIHTARLEYLDDVESSPYRFFCHELIADSLFGTSDSLSKSLKTVQIYDSLMEKDGLFWANLCNQWYIRCNHCFVEGFPSKECARKFQTEENERVKAQVEMLGKEKLAAMDVELRHCVEFSGKTAPQEVLESLPIPDSTKIFFHDVVTVVHRPCFDPESSSFDLLLKTPSSLGNSVFTILNENSEGKNPVWVQFDHIPTAFAHARVFIDTAKLPAEVRPYLELYLEVVMMTQIEREGKIIGHEEVVRQLNLETVSYSTSLGLSGGNFVCGQFASQVVLSVKVEAENYDKACRWLKELLWKTQFPAERLRVAAGKLLQTIPQSKRSGSSMSSAALKNINFDKLRSNHGATNLILQHSFLSNVVKKLGSEPEELCAEFLQFVRQLVLPENLKIQVIFDATRVRDPVRQWAQDFLVADLRTVELPPSETVQFSQDLLTNEGKSGGRKAIIGMSSIDSCFLTQTCLGPWSYDDPDVPSLMVLINLLTTMEGPFWKQIRGLGLSYSYSMNIHPEHGLVYFHLYKCGDPVAAFRASSKIVCDYLSEKSSMAQFEIDGSKSSLVFQIVSEEVTRAQAAKTSWKNFLLRVPPSYNRTLLQKIQNVTVQELMRVLKKYFVSLFDANSANMIITANKAKTGSIAEGMKGIERICEIFSVDSFFGKVSCDDDDDCDDGEHCDSSEYESGSESE